MSSKKPITDSTVSIAARTSSPSVSDEPLISLLTKPLNEMTSEDLREYVNRLRKIRTPDHSPEARIHKETREMRGACSECRKSFDSEPAIWVEDNSFCFYHAKRFLPKAQRERIEKEKAANAGYSDQCTRFKQEKERVEATIQEWKNRREKFIYSGGLHGNKRYLYFAGVLGCWLAHPALGLLAILVLPFILWSIETSMDEPRIREFDASNPKPAPFAQQPPGYRSLPKVILAFDPTNEPDGFVGTGYNRAEILYRDKHICQNCGRRFQDELLEVHHVHPTSDGGCDHKRNLVTLCMNATWMRTGLDMCIRWQWNLEENGITDSGKVRRGFRSS